MRRLQEIYNYHCQCGHIKRLHEGDDYSEYCTGWLRAFFGPCKCKGFVKDNLRYLEALVNERG